MSSPIKHERIESEAKDMLSPWLNIPLKSQGKALKAIKGNKVSKSNNITSPLSHWQKIPLISRAIARIYKGEIMSV